MATQRYLHPRWFATGYFPPNYFAAQSSAPVQFNERYFAVGYFANGYFAKGYFGGVGGATPPVARQLSKGWGPGVQPNARAQFRASPRAIVMPPIPSTPMAAAAFSYTVSSAALSALITSGGLAYMTQPGPGVGPFSNNQFLPSPRGVIAGAPQFRMAGISGSLASATASLSQLQSWAAAAISLASGTANLTTLRTSGGGGAFLTQPGPGVGPFSNSQFQSSPRSTNPGFKALVGSAAANAITHGTALLSTNILLATDVPGAVMLLTEGGSGIGIEGGGGLLVSSPMRGMATATATLGTGNNMAGVARAAANASGALTAAARMAASASSVASGSPALLTGITLAANVTGLSYASAALGSGTTFTVTSAGLASASGALFTQILIAASATGFGSASAQMSSGPQFAAAASASASAAAGLTASILLSAQATGLAQASPSLSGSVILSASASGFGSAQAMLIGASQMSAAAMAAGFSMAALQTAVAPYSAFAFGSASASANLNGNVVLVASAGSISSVTARLLTVLQPPGEFADIRWLRAPRGGDVAYAELFQTVDEQLWYGVNWEDWLASNWEANSSATLSQALRPTIPNGLEFVCITAGQTGAVEPLWPAYAGGVVVDGTAMWQGQAVSAVSLDDTISGSSFSAPSGIVLDSGQVLSQRSYLIIDSTTSVAGTNYDVLCTIFTTGGQQKIAKLRIKVR